MSNLTFSICTKHDESAIIDFLWSIKADLMLPNRTVIEEMTALLFEKGGLLAGYKDGQMIAVLGYFLGEPGRNYANKEVGFVYLTAIGKPYRMTRVCSQGLQFTMETLKEMGIREVRFHAAEDDPYTNRLYSHFAKPLGQELNRRGHRCILYGNTIDNVLAYLSNRLTQRGGSKYAVTPGSVLYT